MLATLYALSIELINGWSPLVLTNGAHKPSTVPCPTRCRLACHAQGSMRKCGHLRCDLDTDVRKVITGLKKKQHQDAAVAKTSSSTFQITRIGTELSIYPAHPTPNYHASYKKGESDQRNERREAISLWLLHSMHTQFD